MGSVLLAGLLTGCANPGPPRAPSLHLPSLPRDLSADRSGDVVELRFTAPRNSTDKLPLRAATISGTLCRQVGKGPCVTVPGSGGTFPRVDAGGRPTIVVWHDSLPADLGSGPRRLLCYRVELFNALGKSAGPSDPAYVVAGTPPARVEHLTAEGSRKGIVLHWAPSTGDAGEVLLRREGRASLPPKEAAKAESATPKRTSTLSLNDDRTAKQDVVWMSAVPDAADRSQNRSLDASAVLSVPYRYQAVRREMVKFGGRTLELRGELSDPVSITLQPVFASAAPTGLVAAAFSNATSPGVAGPFAVDLVWQPVDDADIAGYNVYRERIDASGAAVGGREKLSPTASREPGFHDATAKANERYRYSVTAVDTHGNESAAATTVLEPSEVQ
ncbi:hypothetical protein SAMN05421819_2188 [Bryocella elongata]|uniref:Fibronectin type-III domain-containing protein n=1 Tax=Bryocella elongata TaxID=863522 RepID=A0A1H5YAD0_9BACT|nr:hypothetical protein [Bryocella elongata]SEG20550.1 hypothetical protein SAMN05421819_2188 [Bryocella elongata]